MSGNSNASVVRESAGLVDVIDRVLDKGLVLNADISVSIAGTELLGIKITATLASFETAAKYGLEFPSGTNLDAPAWKKTDINYANCPECGNRREEKLLIEKGCPICGWTSPLSKKKHAIIPASYIELDQDGNYIPEK
ncbi:Gas vesicle protein gvpJ 1 [Methanosarcina barkeri 3]|jgi:gas vesicle structural protein|uniref:Gas vesicle protein gvpJ 1 n=1 Tax=Methanosarcina barkeri 3 TaxID=1434107 RepID=A0A0E3SMF4_METBA|nr:gas vesicle protein [Methanosarcina barkeri]AKB83426.1 Gas vesicle protein gvpJ 1 [Methanosarcina barkeri 3]